METDRYYAYNKTQVKPMMCPTVWVLDLCPDKVMPACWGGTRHEEDIVCAFWFIWEISVDGHSRALPPRELGIKTGISDSESEMPIVWKCDRMVNTLLLWTVNVVFIPGSLFVLEEASFTRVHPCRFSSWLDTWIYEIVSGTRAQLLHLWLIWPARIFKMKTSDGKGNPWGQCPCGF